MEQTKNQANSEPKARQVFLPESLVQKVEAIKARRGGSIGSIVERLANPAILEEYREVVKEMQSELGEAGA